MSLRVPLSCFDGPYQRALFQRSAAVYGLPDHARRLFELVRSISLRQGWDFRLFALSTAVLGWRRSGQIAELAQRWVR